MYLCGLLGLTVREYKAVLNDRRTAIVKREVDKYMGDVDIKAKKNEFSVTVSLQERRKK